MSVISSAIHTGDGYQKCTHQANEVAHKQNKTELCGTSTPMRTSMAYDATWKRRKRAKMARSTRPKNARIRSLNKSDQPCHGFGRRQIRILGWRAVPA
jgi:hypothetical protein